MRSTVVCGFKGKHVRLMEDFISQSLDFELSEFLELIFQISPTNSIFSKSKPDRPARFHQFAILTVTTPLEMAVIVLIAVIQSLKELYSHYFSRDLSTSVEVRETHWLRRFPYLLFSTILL